MSPENNRTDDEAFRKAAKKKGAIGFGDADLTDISIEAIIKGRNVKDETSEGDVPNNAKVTILRKDETYFPVELKNNDVPTISVDDAGLIFPEKTHKRVKRILNTQRFEKRQKRTKKTNAR